MCYAEDNVTNHYTGGKCVYQDELKGHLNKFLYQDLFMEHSRKRFIILNYIAFVIVRFKLIQVLFIFVLSPTWVLKLI